MKKKILTAMIAAVLAAMLTACGGGTANTDTAAGSAAAQAQEEVKQPADLTGEWKQTNSASDTDYQTAVITGDTIEIYWVSETDESKSLYWAGTFTAPTTADEPYTWESTNDHTKTDSAILASTDETKSFTYENGQISYEVSMLGTTKTTHLEKTAELSDESTAIPADGTAESVETTFADNVYQSPDIKIEIKDVKVIPVGEFGNEYGDKSVIAFWYDTTNISGQQIDPSSAWFMNFHAIQDNDPNAVNELELASMPDEQYTDSQAENIKQGGTVSCAAAYELDDYDTPVVLIARDVLGNEIGRQTFTIS